VPADRKVERQRIAIVDIESARERRSWESRFELRRISASPAHDGNDLAAKRDDPVHGLDHRPHIQPAIRTPMPH